MELQKEHWLQEMNGRRHCREVEVWAGYDMAVGSCPIGKDVIPLDWLYCPASPALGALASRYQGILARYLESMFLPNLNTRRDATWLMLDLHIAEMQRITPSFPFSMHVLLARPSQATENV